MMMNMIYEKCRNIALLFFIPHYPYRTLSIYASNNYDRLYVRHWSQGMNTLPKKTV